MTITTTQRNAEAILNDTIDAAWEVYEAAIAAPAAVRRAAVEAAYEIFEQTKEQ